MADANVVGIYAIRNMVDGRIYVGSSTRFLGIRFSEHRKLLRGNRHHSIFLQRSWNKHGEPSFVFELIEIVTDPSALLPREQFWIDKHRSFDKKFGFNISPTAGNSAGRIISAATRAKMSASKTGRRLTPETRAKMSASRTGKTLTAETKKKISIAHAGKPHPPHPEERKARISASGRGMKRSEETRKRLSLAMVRRHATRRAAAIKSD